MTNDLISRSALKEKLQGHISNGTYAAFYVNDAIDNAPTVSFMISPDYVTELQNRNKELIKQLEEVERPQGEWKLIRVADHCGIHDSFVCPFCNYEKEYRKKNFCEECGADLRGEKADENS